LILFGCLKNRKGKERLDKTKKLVSTTRLYEVGIKHELKWAFPASQTSIKRRKKEKKKEKYEKKRHSAGDKEFLVKASEAPEVNDELHAEVDCLYMG